MMNEKTNSKAPSFNIVLAYQGFIDEPVPSHIFDAIVSGDINRIFGYLKAVSLILISALVAVIVSLSMQGGIEEEVSFDDLHSLAVIAHVNHANESVYTTRVASQDVNQLALWLSDGLGKNLEIDELSSIGFHLMGGNLVPDNEGVSASIVYENKQNEKLSLFVRNAQYKDASKLSDSGKLDRYNWLSWQGNGSQFVLVTELDQAELQEAFNVLE